MNDNHLLFLRRMKFLLHLNVDLGSSCICMYSVDGAQMKTLTLRPAFILITCMLLHAHAHHGKERSASCLRLIRYGVQLASEVKKLYNRSYLPQSALEVCLNNLERIKVTDRAHVTIGSHNDHGTFIFRNSVHLVSIFFLSNAICSHLRQLLDRPWDVSPFETLLQRMNHDQVDDALRIFGKCGFCRM